MNNALHNEIIQFTVGYACTLETDKGKKTSASFYPNFDYHCIVLTKGENCYNMRFKDGWVYGVPLNFVVLTGSKIVPS